MAGLQTWVKQLVLIVLMAGLAEMLLPRSEMRRYAHTALGLLILVAVLVPFMSLVRRGIDWEAAFQQVPKVEAVSVDAEVRRLQEAGARLTVETYRARVEQEVVRVAAGVDGVARAEARAEIDADAESPRFGTVRRITVLVTAGPPPRTGEVEPVRPVRIGGAGAEGGEALSPEGAGRLREAVAEAIMREFGLLRSQVDVRIEGGPAPPGAPPAMP